MMPFGRVMTWRSRLAERLATTSSRVLAERSSCFKGEANYRSWTCGGSDSTRTWPQPPVSS